MILRKKNQQKKFYFILVLFSTSCYWLLLESFLLCTAINIYWHHCATHYTITCAIQISSVWDLTTVNSIAMRLFYFPTCCGRSCISFRTIMARTDSQLWNSFFLGLKMPEFHDIQTCRKFTFSPPGIWEWRITVVVVGKSLLTVIIITCLSSNGLY